MGAHELSANIFGLPWFHDNHQIRFFNYHIHYWHCSMFIKGISHFPGSLDCVFIGRRGNDRVQTARYGFHTQRSCHGFCKRTPADVSLADEHEAFN